VGNNGVGDHGELRLALAGPAAWTGLDEVTVAILDEAGTDHWARPRELALAHQRRRAIERISHRLPG